MPGFCFTIDVDYTVGSQPGLEKLYRLCEQWNLRPTLFVTGKFALAYPDLIQEAARAGHELGTHGWAHGENPREDFRRASLADRREWIERSTEAVERVCGVRPRAFRAPNLWISESTLGLLEEFDYEIDSSVPSRRFDLGYGQVSHPRYFLAPLHPYHPDRKNLARRGDSSIWEIAPSAFFMPVNMSALRVFGLLPLRLAIQSLRFQSRAINFYVHPAELVRYEQMEVPYPVPARHRNGLGPHNLGLLERLLEVVSDYTPRYLHELLPAGEDGVAC